MHSREKTWNLGVYSHRGKSATCPASPQSPVEEYGDGFTVKITVVRKSGSHVLRVRIACAHFVRVLETGLANLTVLIIFEKGATLSDPKCACSPL